MELFGKINLLHSLLFVPDAGKLALWGIIFCMLFFAFRFFLSSLRSANNRAATLETELNSMQQQMDYITRMENEAKEEAEKEGKAKGKLLSTISHEVRTPMNGILGMAALLKETTLNAEQKEYTDTIISSGQILLSKVNEILVQDLLESSKTDALSAEPELKVLDIISCIEEVMEMFSRSAADFKNNLLYRVQEGTSTRFISDEKRIRKILINLVENAVAATREGDVIVKIREDKKPGNHPFMIIEVSDTGSGISPELMDRLFISNLPQDYSTRYREKNKGLGLIICKKLAEQLGGGITARNNTEGGATFIVTIPVSLVAGAVDNGNKYTMKGFEGAQVLVIASDAAAASVYCEWLEQWGLLAACAGTVSQAIETLSQAQYNLAIIDSTDRGLPGLSIPDELMNRFPSLPQLVLISAIDESYKQPPGVPVIALRKPLKQHSFFDAVLTQFRHQETKNSVSPVTAGRLSEEFVRNYPLRILVAEDNEVNQKWTTKILKKLGYTPVIAENGKIVLDKISHEVFDLILMDVQMPEMDGLEATRMIRVCLEKQPVIIAMTANVMHGDRQACIQAGMDDYISKPVELPALVSMLEKWALLINERKPTA
ncbi:MAG: response regulator [Bacteroidetes bacterium]|nr:response regulator [Bacteroidota bacterium]